MDLIQHLKEIEDPRIERNKLHLLTDVLMIALCAALSGAEDYDEFSKYGKEKQSLMSKFLDLSNGIPSSSTFRRVFNAVCPEQFSKTLANWIKELVNGFNLKDTVINFDGKSLRGSGIKGKRNSCLQVVTAWSEAYQLSLGQLKVDKKSNEIKAIPLLLESLDIEGATVTADALNTQKAIVEKIIEKEAHYVLAIKTNQGFFAQQIMDHMNRLAEGYLPEQKKFIHHDFGHGRIEKRTCYLCSDIQWIEGKELWKNFGAMAMIESERTSKGKTSIERRYYITDHRDKTAENMLDFTRKHWSIENNLHWQLDVTFKEDKCKVLDHNGAQNLHSLRKIALTMLKGTPTEKKMSLNKKRKMAGWSDGFLLKILSHASFK